MITTSRWTARRGTGPNTATTSATPYETGNPDAGGPTPSAAEPDTQRAADRPPESYLDLSRAGRGRGRIYMLGVTIIIIFGSLLAMITVVTAERLLPTWLPATTPTLLSFVPEFLITLTVVVVVHRRGWRTVITPRPRLDAHSILAPAGTWALIMVVVTVPCAIADPDGLRFGPTTWTGFAIAAGVAVLLIPIQASAEELFFRGYLIQWASLATRRRWVLASMSGLLFTLPH